MASLAVVLYIQKAKNTNEALLLETASVANNTSGAMSVALLITLNSLLSLQSVLRRMVISVV